MHRIAAHQLKSLLLLSALICASVSNASAQGGMSLPGKLDVSQTGAATYTIPIAVPPGTAGMVPALSLDYNSQAGNGLLGVGWSLGGLPSIGHCPQTFVQDGVRGSVNYDANDRFCLDGQRLIVINGGTYGADLSEYRTETEGFTRIIAHGTAGNGPVWFEAHTKSGQVMEFGNTTDSRILALGKTTARSWAVDKVSDTKGNYFTVSYTNDTTNGQAYPVEIDYTGNTAAGLSPYNKVQFAYATRPDTILFYQAGSQQKTTQRLTDVKAYQGATLVSDYQLAYQPTQQSGLTPTSTMSSIALCAADGSCLPATVFSWLSGGDGTFTGVSAAIPNGWHFGVDSSTGWTTLTGDFRGVGKTDLLFTQGTQTFVLLSNGDGTFTGVNAAIPNGWHFGFGPGQGWEALAGDFRGIGKTDLFFTQGSQTFVLLSNGDGTFTGVSAAVTNGWNFGVDPSTGWVTLTGDFRGIGKTDLLFTQGTQTFVLLSNGDGTFTGVSAAIPNGWHFGFAPGQGWEALAADFNGDGKTDLFFTQGAQTFVLLSNGDGTFTGVSAAVPNGWNFGVEPSTGWVTRLGDFNGDGKTDLVFTQGTQTFVLLSNGDGTFTGVSAAIPNGWRFGFAPGQAWGAFVGDFNGDGKTDLLFTQGAQTFVLASNGDGTFTGVSAAVPNGWNFGVDASTGWLVLPGDFNGDGKTDMFFTQGTETFVLPAAGQSHYGVASTTSSLGATTSLTYAPLTNSSVYTKDSSAVYPLVDVEAPVYVTSRVDAANGVGGTYSSSYSYAGAKLDLSGRGYLGFRKMTATDLQTNVAQQTNYRQDFPFIGLVASKTKSIASGSGCSASTLDTTTNTYQLVNASSGSTVSTPSTTSAPYQASLQQSVESSSDCDGTALPNVTTGYQYDAFGNATQVSVSTPDGFSKTTSNTYTNDTTNWFLGRLTKAQVTSTTP